MRIWVTFVLFLAVSASGQVTGHLEDFEDGVLTGWEMPHPDTFFLTESDGLLTIDYLRSASTWEWDNFNYTPPPVDVTSNPRIAVRVRSNITTELAFKPIYENGNDEWLDQEIVGDNTWRNISFTLTQHAGSPLTRVYIYLDGGSTASASGTVQFEWLAMGDSVNANLPISDKELDRALGHALSLWMYSTEGDGEGEFPAGSRSALKAAIDAAEQPGIDVDQAVWDLYDACVSFETSVNASDMGLVDARATKETRYLYGNLFQTAEIGLIFGMHDATGYGVGWSGDDDRSDVKDVCGDYPGLYSEDLNKMENGYDMNRVRYRVTQAYKRGGVTTFSWHQYDPDGRHFYAEDIGNERIVETIVPGGTRHEDYKAKLREAALFFKSLRGDHGESIPIIFRPYHEHLGDWFWWGPAHCTTDEYNTLWRFTWHYLTDTLNVHNLIWAISPSLSHVDQGDDYFNVYPGDDYVDIFGADDYFSYPVGENERNAFIRGLGVVADHALARDKLPAMTEMGQEALPSSNWFTYMMLNPLKYDDKGARFAYAAVWRNARTTHHFAPYPGHPSVPDFLAFYADPYTLFQQDLPDMYTFPQMDATPPIMTLNHDAEFTAVSTAVTVELETNERADLRYSRTDQPFSAMINEFDTGQGGRVHSTTVTAGQGETVTIYIRASDSYGNSSAQSTAVTFTVDTLQAPVIWNDSLYPDSDWPGGMAPIGNSSGDVTPTDTARTVYFRQHFNLEHSLSALGLLLRCHDGAAAYINGVEIGRRDLPVGDEPGYMTPAENANAFTQIFVFDDAALTALHIGDNVIAVEVHTINSDNGDLSFDARLFDPSTIYIDLGTEWFYYDQGAPPVKTVGELSPVGQRGEERLPRQMTLQANYPNPFNPETVIPFALNRPERVTLSIHNALGQRIAVLADKKYAAGVHRVVWHAGSYSSGIYFVRLKAGASDLRRKILLLK